MHLVCVNDLKKHNSLDVYWRIRASIHMWRMGGGGSMYIGGFGGEGKCILVDLRGGGGQCILVLWGGGAECIWGGGGQCILVDLRGGVNVHWCYVGGSMYMEGAGSF